MRVGILARLVILLLALSLSSLMASPNAQAKTACSKHKHHHHCAHACPNKCKNVIGCLKSESDCKQFVADLKDSGVACSLCCGGPYTIFAPSDAAFAKLPKSNSLSSDKGQMAKVLKYHIVPRKLTAADLANLRSVKTLEGESLMINNKDGKIIVDGAIVTKADINAKNGVIHIIDCVCMPERGK